MLQAVNIQM